MADPFGPTLGLGEKHIIWQDFCRKQHDNGRNWTEKGACVPGPSPLGSANVVGCCQGGYGMRQKHCAGIFEVPFPYLPYPY